MEVIKTGKIQKIALGLGLIGLLQAGCKGESNDIVLSEGKIDGNMVRIVQEVKDFDVDTYRIELYNKDGKLKLTAKSISYRPFKAEYDNGSVINIEAD